MTTGWPPKKTAKKSAQKTAKKGGKAARTVAKKAAELLEPAGPGAPGVETGRRASIATSAPSHRARALIS